MSDATWRRSSRCAADRPQCVEVRGGREAGVRDSKNPDGARLDVPPTAVNALVRVVSAA